jgi:NADH dehydrogenase/NADH:ubiquinone oxidoreductase subunit G
METVNIKINNKDIQVEKGTLILDAAKSIGVSIPTLCYHPDQEIKANCRVCAVEVEGMKNLQTACSTQAAEGQY